MAELKKADLHNLPSERLPGLMPLKAPPDKARFHTFSQRTIRLKKPVKPASNRAPRRLYSSPEASKLSQIKTLPNHHHPQ
ncbi:hypothetical protein EV682_105177 [Iodobacter fluviatilis]|uniref:Uncharacterized protein n=1 Tax=Iodobacter fluviatilis TaxID=537 RepID=A0A377Q572_9NEIS|nr:hypothetical protein EV682_105177 [Iodobacter fluviatilis]STQ90384.1 Uncharacterised protein [Iodobacter fluviatilis]